MIYASYENVYKDMFPFWDKIPLEDKEEICRNSVSTVYSKGETIHDGNECSGVFLVRTGSLRVYIMSDDGKDITLYRLHKGDMCMLSASCVLQTITFDVMVDAEEDSNCIVVAGHAFAALSDRVPSVRIFALQATVDRFSTVIEVMQSMLFMSFDYRLAAFLLDEIARSGGDTVKLTHEAIAKYMGSAREVVTRTMKKFTKNGLVEASRGGVRILDKKRLRAMTV